jgi:hypothetical protein
MLTDPPPEIDENESATKNIEGDIKLIRYQSAIGAWSGTAR